MNKYLKNERGLVPIAAVIFILSIATAVAAGAVTANHVDLSKLKNGQAVYHLNGDKK